MQACQINCVFVSCNCSYIIKQDNEQAIFFSVYLDYLGSEGNHFIFSPMGSSLAIKLFKLSFCRLANCHIYELTSESFCVVTFRQKCGHSCYFTLIFVALLFILFNYRYLWEVYGGRLAISIVERAVL